MSAGEISPDRWPESLRRAAPQLFELAPDGCLVVDADGLIQMANRQLLSMLGYEAEGLAGQPVEMLLPESHRPDHVGQRRGFTDAPRSRPMGDPQARVSARHRQGHLIPVEIALSPITLDSGTVVLAAVRDISQRLSVEAELDAIRRSLDIIDHGVLLVRPGDLAITYANAGAAYQTGISSRDLTSDHTLVDLCVELDEARLRQVIAPLVSETVQSLTQITSFGRRHGEPFPVELTLSYPPVSAGFNRPVVALVRNISDRIRVEQERDRREQLLTSLAEIRRSALAEVSVEQVLADAAQAALDQLDATHLLIVSIASGQLWCRAMASTGTLDLTGTQLERSGALEHSVGAEVTVVADGMHDPLAESVRQVLGPIGPTLFAPLVTNTSIEGVLIACRAPDARRFRSEEVSVAATLASEAAITLVLDRAREDRRYLAVVEDRERIARDLHDLVIQRLFATGMGLQASLGSPERLGVKANEAITDLDETIAVIRRAIFALTRADQGLRGELDRLIDRHRSVGRNDIHFEVSGDLDVLSPSHQAQLLPALNELLSNVERHANADTAQVLLVVGSERLTLTVTDDGEGMSPDSPPGFGLRNLEIRAAMLDGTIEHRPGDRGIGTSVIWSVPITPANGT